MIAVTGATGQVGGRVAARLAQRGVEQRLVVRDADRAPRLDGAEVRVAGGYGAREEMQRALDGVHTLFLVPAAESPDRVEQHVAAVDAAVAAGVEHIAYLSFLRADPGSTFLLARHHAATEEHVRSTGVAWTFPRMSMYLDFVTTMVGSDGVIRGPGGTGALAPVLRDDVADAVVAVLLDPEAHRGATYDLTGRESFTFAEAADTMSRVSGKRISYYNETLEEAWASRAGMAPDWEVEGWISSYAALAGGELDLVTDHVAQLAGHEPVTLAEYLEAEPEALAHVQPG